MLYLIKQFMKRSLILLISLPILLFSQEKNKVDGNSGTTNWNEIKGQILGTVKTDTDNQVLEYATVSLKNTKTDKLIEGTITDKKGKFLFENIAIGEYKLTISFIGYENRVINITTTKSKPNYSDNNILISVNTKLLSEVTIEERKAIYETKIDKIVYNAENDLNDSENDATDVLRKAPLLSVDLDGNVTLRGSKNIKFLVNGKASSFFATDVATALQMIPADQIKTIEVITSPGAKYDGEGDAGIVNIITKKAIIDGYNATFNTMTGTKVTRSNFNLNIGKGKFGLSARAGMRGSWPGRIGTNEYTRLDWKSIQNGDTLNLNTLKQEGKSENYYQGYSGSINAFYNLNTFNSLNSSFVFGGKTSPNINENTAIYTHSTDSLLSYFSKYISDKTDRTLNMEWTTDFTKKFADNEERELTLAFQLGGDINDGNTNIEETKNNILQKRFNQNDEKVIEETIQIDYTHPFGGSKKSNEMSSTKRTMKEGKNYEGGGRRKETEGMSKTNKIEIGAKIINRDREMVYSNKIDGSYANAEQFNYNQLVASSYLSTEFSLPQGLGLKTGIRYENTQTSGKWLNSSNIPFEKGYGNWLPTLIFSKSFSPMRSIKLTYNQRITRPSVQNINTNENFLDSRNYTIGNPKLKPTKTDQYEFAVNSFGKILQASTQIYYKHSYDVIESFLDTIENGNSISTYKNIGETRQMGGSFFGSINLKKLNFRISFDLYNYSGRDESYADGKWTQPIVLYSYYTGGSYDLGNNWKAEAFGFFRSPNQTIQGTSTSFSMMSFGIDKSFKNKRGSIGFRVIEPFRKDKEFISNLEGDFFSQSSTVTTPFRSFGISFKYTFGKLTFKDANNKTNIKNDDIKQESGGEF